MVQPDKPQMTMQYGTEKLRFACGKSKSRIHILTHSQCLILTVFPRQKFLRESASVLRYMYTDYPCLLRLHNYCTECPFYCVFKHSMFIAPEAFIRLNLEQFETLLR